MEVIELCRNDDINIKQIAKTISNDPALSTKILKTVNSSYYGLSQPVSTISHALVILGLNAVKTLALSFSLVSTVKQSGGGEFDPNVIFRRSLYSAVAARSIAQRVGIAEQEEAFLAGLLQDLGVIALVQTLQGDYVKLLSQVGDRHAELAKLEEREMDLDHTMVGEALGKKWRLPDVLVKPIRWHEDPRRAPSKLRPMVQAVSLGGIAADIYLHQENNSSVEQFFTALREHFDLGKQDGTELLEKIGEGTKEMANLFEIVTGPVRDTGEILAQANEVLLEVSLQSQHDVEQLAVQNKQLHEKATRDALTGAANRGYFNEFLCQQFEQATRQTQPVSLILLDGDRFKSVNDTHGHLAGDKVLMALARTLQNNAPEHALVARYGGEEFTVILPNTTRSEAAQIAEKLRIAIENTDIDAGENLTLHITASMGVACYDGVRFFKRPEQLIKAADQAVYAAKSSGRNCVRVFAPKVAAKA